MSTSILWSGPRVRDEFIKFYQQHHHVHVPSSSVVPVDDPTLLFTNAGMNQFKPRFLGPSTDNSEGPKRVVNYQKCIRAGGKHNDLDDVGQDTYHHTFFEMLGTWSFGDYFKAESIDWAWELLTQVYKLNPNQIYVTYFQGNPDLQVPPDEEARDIWRKYLPDERILPFGMKENFWEMGDSGPCGPCSEIHYDRIGNRDASHLVNRDDPSVIEIWNHVFIQFNRLPEGHLVPLPEKHVDTGMGLERLTSILESTDSNYETDLFRPIFDRIHEVSQCRPYQGRFGSQDLDKMDLAYRVIVDHIRTLTIAIGDGAVPGNIGRNYVIRKILRRAVRYSQQILKVPSYNRQPPEGFLSQLVPAVMTIFASVYPTLSSRVDVITSTITQEELMFLRTLERGTRKFTKMVAKLTTPVLPGPEAWMLSDTYGLPLDIIQMMAQDRGLQIDLEAYDKCRQRCVVLSQTQKHPQHEQKNNSTHHQNQIEVP
jgi:alanyl-tRNA synthetase